MFRRRWKTHLLIVGVYVLLALVLTWPLAAHLGSHVPGNGVDDPPLTWNLWWVRYAFLELGSNPFACEALFYPLGINLAFYTLTVLNGLLSLPLQAVVGLVPASNILLLSSFVLSGYGAFLLVAFLLGTGRRHPGSRLQLSDGGLAFAAFVSGLLYAFASSKLAYAALGQWNIASSQWIPFYVLCLLKMEQHPGRRRYAVLAALFLVFQAYAEITYATFLVLFTALWLVWQVVAYFRLPGAARSRRAAPRLVGNLSLVGLLFVVGLAPMLAIMIPDMLVEGAIFVEGGGFADVFSADLVGFVVPAMYHPLLGSLVEKFGFDYSVGQHIYLGYSVLALAAVGVAAWWRRGPSPHAPCPPELGHSVSYWVKFWSLSTLGFWLLTLGPSLRINGHDTGLPLPFALVARLPFFEGNRYPSRYSVMLFLGLAVLVAFGLAAIQRRLRKRSALGRLLTGLALVALVLFEHLAVPLPLSDMRVPPVYRALAAEMPADSTLLDLPVAWRNGFRVTGTEDPIIMFQQYYQTVHEKRLLAGNTSRNPALKFQYFTEAPVINTILALERQHPVSADVVERDRALAASVLRFLNIEAVLVHPVQTGPDMVPYVEDVMPVERWYEDDEGVAYRVSLPPWPEAWTVDPGDELGRMSYAEGWGLPGADATWAQRRVVRLLVPMNGQGQEMAFRAYGPMDGQELEVEVNGQTVSRIGMAAGWMDYEVDLPGEMVQTGLNTVRLRFDALVPAGQVRVAPRAIGTSGVESPVNLVVQSAGQEVGDFGHIYVDGRDLSPNERGYNIVVLDPEQGAIQATAAFDTHLDEGASRAMADFLRHVPPGSIVVVAAADEVSRLLGEEAVAALRGIGAEGDLRDRFRWGHAIIGVQGAAPGTALEALDWMRPVSVVVGEGVTEPHLAAAFGVLRFEAGTDR